MRQVFPEIKHSFYPFMLNFIPNVSHMRKISSNVLSAYSKFHSVRSAIALEEFDYSEFCSSQLLKEHYSIKKYGVRVNCLTQKQTGTTSLNCSGTTKIFHSMYSSNKQNDFRIWIVRDGARIKYKLMGFMVYF